jgi:hypothetical protein
MSAFLPSLQRAAFTQSTTAGGSEVTTCAGPALTVSTRPLLAIHRLKIIPFNGRAEPNHQSEAYRVLPPFLIAAVTTVGGFSYKTVTLSERSDQLSR